MQKVEYKFFIGQEVKIKAITQKGIVTSLWTGRNGNEIQVRYPGPSKYEQEYFFENELESL
jgi:hypothetical protein